MKQASTSKHSPVRVVQNVWFMFRYTFRYMPSYIWVTLVEAVGRAVWHINSVWFLKYIFDALEKGVEFAEILCFTLLVAGYSAVFEFFNKWRLEVYCPVAKLAVHEGMQTELYQKAKELDQSCYDDPAFYNDFIWAIRESDSRTATMMEQLGLFLNRIISSIVILIFLASMEWEVAVILLVSIGLNFCVKNARNRVNYERDVEMNPINRKLEYIQRVFYLPDYAKELRRGDIVGLLRRRFEETTEDKVKCVQKYAGKIFWLGFTSVFLTGIVPRIVVISYLLIRYVTDPLLTLGTLSASISATFKLYWTIDDIGNYLTKYNEHSLYIEKFRKFIDYQPCIRGEETQIPAFQSLVLQNVNFSYPFDEEKEVLKAVNLEIRKGAKVAFVGYNGAGKSTLMKLLMRLYDPTKGEILYNGRDIREYNVESYRKHIGAVFQDYKVFAASVAENIMGGEYDSGQEEQVMQAVRAASFQERLAMLPKGLDTQLTREFSEEGIGLSGGEEQKVAIARVFAHPYDLMILDEPSSALDPIAEYELNQSILRNAADKTVIFISHRLSTTRMADCIYMFDQGEIIEYGSHEELMAQNGKYAEMYRVQAKKYRMT
ncbi:MAG: ABC transporter ATP-binding protein [Lachnospiraceae bacterium]|nr:ABC transporter ATP-binding protein [Lachnospiraceae bacterium]